MFFNIRKLLDSPRSDEVGYSVARLRRSILSLFLMSGFFFATFLTLSVGLPTFYLLLVFPVYWLILFLGLNGARRRKPRMLMSFFLSKSIFMLVLLMSLAIIAMLGSAFEFAVFFQAESQASQHPQNACSDCTDVDRKFSTPIGSYDYDSGSGTAGENQVDNLNEDDVDVQVGYSQEDELVLVSVIVISIGIMGFAHILMTTFTLYLTMRTLVLLKIQHILPLIREQERSSTGLKKKSDAAVWAQKSYAGAEYRPLVYVM